MGYYPEPASHIRDKIKVVKVQTMLLKKNYNMLQALMHLI